MLNRLKVGDVIGVVAPSNPIVGDNILELDKAKSIAENAGFKVKYGKNIFSNTHGYSASAKEKAEDINDMFRDKSVKMIWFAKGGENCNSVFDYLDFDLIKNNPKIICGFSDITFLIDLIYDRCGFITFQGTNFKTIATDVDDYGYNEVIDRCVNGSREFSSDEKYITVRSGVCEGKLIGGNLSLIRGLTCGKYSIDFTDKILFLEELGYETDPCMVSNHLYFMKQNGVFDKIKGLWIGNYEHESMYRLEDIVLDVLGDDYDFPIIKSNNFGHGDKKLCIPIGVKAKIDTNELGVKISLLEDVVI